MNANMYFSELNETEVTEIVKTVKEPKTEADRLNAWFNGLDLKANETAKADFFKYEIGIHHAVTETYNRYYMTAMSPQKKSMGRLSFPDTYARGTMDDIKAGIEKFIKQMEAKIDRRNAKTAAKREARSSFVNPYKVGDFLYSSWGYDQTNREFYQVVEVGERSLKVREVAQNHESTGYDSWNASPRRDQFIKPAQWLTIQVYENGYHTIPSPVHGGLYKYEGKALYASNGH